MYQAAPPSRLNYDHSRAQVPSHRHRWAPGSAKVHHPRPRNRSRTPSNGNEGHEDGDSLTLTPAIPQLLCATPILATYPALQDPSNGHDGHEDDNPLTSGERPEGNIVH